MVGIIVLTLFLLAVVGTLVWSVKHVFTRAEKDGNEQEEKPKKRTRKKVKDESESREN